MRRITVIAGTVLTALALSGCAGGAAEIPVITGTPSSYGSVTELRDAFVAAGGECPTWESIDPGDYDAEAGRCDDSTVIALYRDPAQLAEAVERATNLATDAHLLVGDNWMLNTPNPHEYVDALGGTVVTG